MSAMPSTSGWYFEWVDFHRKATAANAEAVAALISAREIAIDIWQSTSDELHQCTKRLVATRRTPKFANEHADAIGTELVTLRAERERAGFMVAVQPTGPSDCPMRCEGGELIAPMVDAVKAGKVSPVCVVLCDMCQRGKAEIIAQDRKKNQAGPTKEDAWKKKTLMTLSKYIERCNGVDGIAMLRQHEAECAAKIRAHRGEFASTIPALAAMVGHKTRVPYKERPRGPEHFPEDES
jgi:hypothetical protein